MTFERRSIQFVLSAVFDSDTPMFLRCALLSPASMAHDRTVTDGGLSAQFGV